jgi:hypothetical protein
MLADANEPPGTLVTSQLREPARRVTSGGVPDSSFFHATTPPRDSSNFDAIPWTVL